MEDTIGTVFYVIIMIAILGASLLKKRKKVQKQGTVSRASGNVPNQKPTTGQKLESIFSDFLKDQFPDVMNEDEFPEIGEEEAVTKPMSEKYEKIVEPEINIPQEGISAFANDDPSTPTIETGLFKNLATAEYEIVDEIIKSENDKGFIKENEIGNIIENFDLKKAIIYSEILSPKYFKIQESNN